MKLLAHHWLRLLCTTRPLLEDASITVPPPATNSHMAVYNHDITCLYIIEIRDLCISSRISPARGGKVTLVNSHLVQTPVYKSRNSQMHWDPCPPHMGLPSLEEATEISAPAPCPTGLLTAGGVLPDGLLVLPPWLP